VRFRSVVELGGKSATGIAVPDDVVAALDGGQRPAVLVTLGDHRFRTTVARMGGRFLVPLSAENRTAAGVAAGDAVDVTVELDIAPREVELPDDLRAALGEDPGASAFFAQLSFTHRKEWVRWITEARRSETRATRLARTVEAMRSGRRTR
jgi:hypothetical protein